MNADLARRAAELRRSGNSKPADDAMNPDGRQSPGEERTERERGDAYDDLPDLGDATRAGELSGRYGDIVARAATTAATETTASGTSAESGSGSGSAVSGIASSSAANSSTAVAGGLDEGDDHTGQRPGEGHRPRHGQLVHEYGDGTPIAVHSLHRLLEDPATTTLPVMVNEHGVVTAVGDARLNYERDRRLATWAQRFALRANPITN